MSKITVSKGGSSYTVLNYPPEILEKFIHPTTETVEVNAASLVTTLERCIDKRKIVA
jgi:hypothetical protein